MCSMVSGICLSTFFFNWSDISDILSISSPPPTPRQLCSRAFCCSVLECQICRSAASYCRRTFFSPFSCVCLLFSPSNFILFLHLFPYFTRAQPPLVSLLGEHIWKVYRVLVDWKYLNTILTIVWLGENKPNQVDIPLFPLIIWKGLPIAFQLPVLHSNFRMSSLSPLSGNFQEFLFIAL